MKLKNNLFSERGLNMLLNDFEERMKFLNELHNKYGNILLEEALKKFSNENIKISECKVV